MDTARIEISKEVPYLGFNWATTFQPWIPHGGDTWCSIIVSIGPRLFSHGYSRHFSAFTAIGKKPIFAHTVNFYEYF